jgi:hypothetical protein
LAVLGVLGLYSLIEDIVRATRPMARRLSRREIHRRYREQYIKKEQELLRWSTELVRQNQFKR